MAVNCCDFMDDRRYHCEVIRLLTLLLSISTGGAALQREELCDDVNGDGSLIVPFTRFFLIDVTVNPVVPTAAGDFTPDLSASYTVIGPVISCINAEAFFTQEVLCYEVVGNNPRFYTISTSGGTGNTNTLVSYQMNPCSSYPNIIIGNFIPPQPITNLEVVPNSNLILATNTTIGAYELYRYNLDDWSAPITTTPITGFVDPIDERLCSIQYHPQTGDLWAFTVDGGTLATRFYTLNESSGLLALIATGPAVTANVNENSMAITEDGNIFIVRGPNTVAQLDNVSFASFSPAFVFAGIEVITAAPKNRIGLVAAGATSAVVSQTGVVISLCGTGPSDTLSLTIPLATTVDTVSFIRRYLTEPPYTVVDYDLAGNIISVPTDATVGNCAQKIDSNCNDPVIVKDCCSTPTGVTACYTDPNIAPFERVDTFASGAFFLGIAPPPEATQMQVLAWGAGGGAGFNAALADGGAGAFAQGTFAAQTTLIIVGEGGGYGTPDATTVASPNGGRGGTSNGTGVGGGGGGASGVLGINSRWLVEAGAGAGGGGGTATAGRGGHAGASIGQTGTAGTAGSGGAGGQGGQLTIGGLGGIIGTSSDGVGASSISFYGYSGGDGGFANGGLEGGGGGGGGGATAGGGGNGRSTGGFDASGGGGGTCWVDPNATDISTFGGMGIVPPNVSSPYYVAGSGFGGVAAAGGSGLVVIRWFNEGVTRTAAQYQVCNADGSTTMEWRDVETNDVIDSSLLAPCIDAVCETPSVGLFGSINIDVNPGGNSLVINLLNVNATDGSNVISIGSLAEDAQTNGWGIPPTGPFPAIGDYDQCAFLPYLGDWTPGSESYFQRIEILFGYNSEYSCVYEIYVPQFETAVVTDYSNFYYRNLRDGIWRDFSESGNNLSGTLDCLVPVSQQSVTEVKVCNLEPEFATMYLCDDQGGGVYVPFIRKYRAVPQTIGGGVVDLDISGTSHYTVIGAVVLCTPPEEVAALTLANSYLANIASDTLGRSSDSVTASLSTDALMSGLTAISPQFYSLSISATGETTIASAGGSRVRVISLSLTPNVPVTFEFLDGSGGTPLTGITEVLPNTQFLLPFAPTGWFETTPGNDLVINMGGPGQVSGCLTYILVP